MAGMALVERRAALAALTATLAESTAGAGRVAAVTGGLASGKSSLLDVFAGQVADSGALLLTATGSRGERAIPLGAVGQLVSGLADDGVGTLADRVLRAAAERPVVLVVDDVQHLDGASLRALAGLRDRFADAPVLLVFTEWEPLSAGDLTMRADRRVRLGPLSEAGVAELLCAELGDDRATAACHRVSGGNPLLVHALVADHRAGRAVPGNSFRQAVLACLHRWEPRLLEVAQALAVLSGQTSPGLVAELTGSSRAVVARTTGILAAAGLLVGGRFRHDAVPAAVLDSMPADDSARLHLRAAEVLHRRRAAPMDVARLLVAAGQVGGAWGVAVLCAAAADATACDKGEFAVRCLELALPATTGRMRSTTAAALARIAWRYAPAELPCLSEVDTETAVRYALWHASDTVPDLLAQVTDPRAATGFTLGDEWIRGPRATRVARGTPVALWEHSAAALLPGLLRGENDEVVRDAERVLHGCLLGDQTAEVLASALTALAYADRPDRAEYWCGELVAEAGKRGATMWLALLEAVGAEISLRRGAIRTAREQAEVALRRLPARSWGVLVALPLSTIVSADTALGVADSAGLREVVPDTVFDTVMGVRYLRARGQHYLATDRLLAAVADFQACGRFLTRNGIDLPALAPWRTDLAEAHVRMGRRRIAAHLAQAQAELPSCGRLSRARSLRVLAVAEERGLALMQQSAEEFRASGDRFGAAVALAELSGLLAERGEPARSRRVAKTATDEALECGVDDLVDRVLRQGAVTTLERETSGGLSDAEHRVASLAALGHTNREISTKLYITVSTVEQHLTKIYRKLGVSRRSDLPSVLTGHSDRAGA
ncbi:LuxR family transcriptional regulator [Actinokineospora sp. NBRC 105648]|uniref:helix-turn-helix transcriptional regulator n=1 Tax=Actinokineospora sp. NBRC 105648 TaxID=3032206 RepID=UPI0024A12C55|nr:LuxR family transcriptional regulator [Actinokineospora sp. NBRC 105648]GLZ36459.1 LuxR family transcriptional regulator [Actinokineospora sp. NBRC 105648]